MLTWQQYMVIYIFRAWLLKCDPWVFSGGLQGPNCFHDNTNMLLAFPTVLTFALMMQSKEGKATGNLVLVKSVAPNSSGHRHFPFQADLRMSVMKLLRWFILLCLDLGVHVSLSFLPLLYTLSDYLQTIQICLIILQSGQKTDISLAMWLWMRC